MADLLVTYATRPTLIAKAGSEFGFVSLYYKTLEGILYSVPDIFRLGPPIKPEPVEGNPLFTEAEPRLETGSPAVQDEATTPEGTTRTRVGERDPLDRSSE